MKICIVHDDLPDAQTPDALDTLEEVAFVRDNLIRLGYRVTTRAFGSDIAKNRAELIAENPDLIFNLVESVAGEGQLSVIATEVFENLGLAYTGNPTLPHLLSANKAMAKRMLIRNGLPTPLGFSQSDADKAPLNVPYIIKAIGEHDSIGLSDASIIVPQKKGDLTAALRERNATGLTFLAEMYIDGREFNVAILGDHILPPAEMVFSKDFKGYKILTYEAKWDEDAESFQKSQRSFNFEPDLRDRLIKIAQDTREKLDLRGYTRLDFRANDAGDLFIIDLNTNPCISPDSGFIAMAEEAGLQPSDVFQRIVKDVNV